MILRKHLHLLILLFSWRYSSPFQVSTKIRYNFHIRATTFDASNASDKAQENDKQDSSSVTEDIIFTSNTKPTLYDVLGASPTDTRAELKQKYVALAKKSHPDAIRDNPENAEVDFAELASAWSILSDSKQRRRYDRSLQAEQFSNDVTSWAEKLGKEAAPVAISLGKIAMPFIRKTTAATVATFQAATKKRAEKDADFSRTFQDAMKAARKAGRYVDSLELTEKAQVLEERAKENQDEAKQAKQKLERIAQERLDLVLYVPGSGLTAEEAMIFWTDFNQTVNDTISIFDRAIRQRHRIEYEIEALRMYESEYVEAQKADTQAQEDYQKWTQAKIRAQQDIIKAERDEAAARRALIDAQQRASDARVARAEADRQLATTEQRAQKSDVEIEKRSLALVKQSEKVRKELRVKAKEVHECQGVPEDDMPQDQSPSRLKDLKNLRLQERILSQSAKRLESNAQRLLSRAEKLRRRAAELEAMD